MGYNSIILKTNSAGLYSCNESNQTIHVSNDSLFQSGNLSLALGSDSVIALNPFITDSTITFWQTDYCLFTSTPELLSITTEEIKIYPNPFSEKINLTAGSIGNYEVCLYDITSRKIIQQKFTYSVSLNTEQLAKGLYLYEVRSKDGSCKKGKIVKD